jgi:hypothetical protein
MLMYIKNLNYLITQFNAKDRKQFPGSMSPIEILVFIFLCITKKIEVVIESGRQYGYSTFFISLFCKKNKIKFISIDKESDATINSFSRRLLKNNKVIYKKNDFYKSIDNIIYKVKDKRVALLIDGPKGIRAHIKSFFLGKKFNNLIFFFFDNMPNNYLSAKAMFMYSRVFCFDKIYIKNNLNKVSSITNFQIKDLKKNKIYNKVKKFFLNNKSDTEFVYVFSSDRKKSIFCYLLIIFFIIKQKYFYYQSKIFDRVINRLLRVINRSLNLLIRN